MPAAGLHLIHTDRLRFARDGCWYADGEPVLHRRLALLFSRHLRRKDDGGFEIWIDDRFHADVDVDDTLYVITMVYIEADGSIRLDLSDGTSEPLDPTSLAVGPDDALYSRVKTERERARFLRPAQNQLADLIEEIDGGFALRCGGRVYPITRD